MATRTIRNKLPEYNVEYTFIIPNAKYEPEKPRTYTYQGLNAHGRVILMNVKTKRCETWSPGHFSHMRKTQLISAKQLAPDVAHQREPKADVALKTYEEKCIYRLRTLSPAQVMRVTNELHIHPHDIARECERLYNDKDDNFTQEFVNRVCSNMLRALAVADGKPAKIGLFNI